MNHTTVSGSGDSTPSMSSPKSSSSRNWTTCTTTL
jgi:hypothetical protein